MASLKKSVHIHFSINYSIIQLFKDPSTAIPKGTILAIVITSFWYALIAVICAGTTKRQATGSIDDLLNGTSLNCTINKCTYGSQNDYQVNSIQLDEALNC